MRMDSNQIKQSTAGYVSQAIDDSEELVASDATYRNQEMS
jgi:hypothetical protein